MNTEPTEGDIIFSNCGRLGARTAITIYGEGPIGSWNTYDEAAVTAKAWMEQNQFWPDVWILSDHGNYHPATL
jgi:hypothetical protein